MPESDGERIEIGMQGSVARSKIAVGEQAVKRGEGFLPVVGGDVAAGGDTENEEDEREEGKTARDEGRDNDAIEQWIGELSQAWTVDGGKRRDSGEHTESSARDESLLACQYERELLYGDYVIATGMALGNHDRHGDVTVVGE